MNNRYAFTSRESFADTLAWAGYSQEEIDKKLVHFLPTFWDREEKRYISITEYNRRMIEDMKYES